MGERKHNHYFKSVEGLKDIDVYRVLSLFNVTDPMSAARNQKATRGRRSWWWERHQPRRARSC
jgi:hypothetical protein